MELKLLYELMTDVWRFLKKYQPLSLTDKTCERLRAEQEAIVEKYKMSENVYKLASDLTAAALGYLYRGTPQKGGK